MIFSPFKTTYTGGSYMLQKLTSALTHPCLNKDIIKEFWNNFTFHASTLDVTETSEYVFSVGNAERLPLCDFEYTINVTADGISVYAANEKALLHGFMALLDRICPIDDVENEDKTAASIDCCMISDRPCLESRMVHFCIFPETELWELQRFVRFCGALKYTHIILEFWGMLKFDCMKELSWSHAYTKEDIRPIVREANDLGLEVVPMFNHWGHASACRHVYGKHVVLDQDISLQTYFNENGWCWEISKPKVKALLRNIRNELIDLCGEGEYFHVGCDEAYNYSFDKDGMDAICGFLNEIGAELQEKGRRAIVWSDMFLYRYPHYNSKNFYECNAPSPEAERYMISHLEKHLVIADWQYDIKEGPEQTAPIFKNAGFDCLMCPFDKGLAQSNSVISTAKDLKLMGFIHTTWHTLSTGLPYVTVAAIMGYEDGEVNLRKLRADSAALMRKVYSVNGDYRKSGWSKTQICNK